MGRSTGRDVGRARGLLHDLAASTGLEGFARLGVEGLPRLVRSELTTLSVCDLTNGRRFVIGSPACALSPGDIACFDRYFFEHPLVRFHSGHPRAGAHRISDSLTTAAFRRTAIYNEYYRRIGVSHVLALPVHVDRRTLVSFVLNRAGHDFTDAERDLLDVARSWLAAMYRNAIALDRAMRMIEALRRELADRSTGDAPPDPLLLTAREREVLRWVGAGKSNVQIATILGTSPRTVQKHLEHVYVKLGVENRLAAVMRVGRDLSQSPGAAGVRRKRKSTSASAAKGRQR
jgi:DNA-binding CsgD family transcriptional regulator